MTPRTPLSAASERTTAPAITSLMQLALGNPDLISLAAGFVDQATLPVDATAREVAALMSHPSQARRALQYGTTIGDLLLRQRLVTLLEASEGVPTGAYESILPRTIVTTGSCTGAPLVPGEGRYIAEFARLGNVEFVFRR